MAQSLPPASVSSVRPILPEQPLPVSVLARLDHSLMSLRHILVRPVTTGLPIPSLGRSVDFAKVAACEAVAQSAASSVSPSVKNLASLLHLDHSTMSRVLADAESEGLVVRATDESDRRRTVVELTTDGSALVDDGVALRTWFMGQLLQDWSEGDVTLLTDLLERAVATFDERFASVREEAEARLGFPVLSD